MIDLHGHSCRRNVFIYGPKVCSSSQKSVRAKSLAFLLSTMTDMFRFQSCIWKVRLAHQISKAKKRTFRGVFLNISKSKFAFTFEHSVSGYDSRLKKKVAFNEKNLREMGRLILEAFSKFVISGLSNQSIYFSDYCTKQFEGKPKEIEAKRKADHDEFWAKLKSHLQAKDFPANLNDLIASMNRFQEETPNDQYSEGGSDSEFSDEDMEAGERAALLRGMAEYSKAFVKGTQTDNFSKSVRKDFQRLQKKKKRDLNVENIKQLELKKRFEKFENYSQPDDSQASRFPEIVPADALLAPKPLQSKTPDKKVLQLAVQDESLRRPREPRLLKRDHTMPHLKQQTEPKKTVSVDKNIFETLAPPRSHQDSYNPPVPALKRTAVLTHSHTDMLLKNAPPHSLLPASCKLAPRDASQPWPAARDPRPHKDATSPAHASNRLVSELLQKEMQQIKQTYLSDIEAHKRQIAKSTKSSKDYVQINVKTLELNVVHPRHVLNARHKVQLLTAGKFGVK